MVAGECGADERPQAWFPPHSVVITAPPCSGQSPGLGVRELAFTEYIDGRWRSKQGSLIPRQTPSLSQASSKECTKVWAHLCLNRGGPPFYFSQHEVLLGEKPRLEKQSNLGLRCLDSNKWFLTLSYQTPL